MVWIINHEEFESGDIIQKHDVNISQQFKIMKRQKKL